MKSKRYVVFSEREIKIMFDRVDSFPFHSKSNGTTESAVKPAKSILRKKKDSDQFMALLNYLNTPYQNSETSPFENFFH